MNIANIHVVRDSWNKLKELCDNYSTTVDGDPSKLGSNWLSQLEVWDINYYINKKKTTRWLDNLSTTLSAAVKVADSMENKKESVLIHCSDGYEISLKFLMDLGGIVHPKSVLLLNFYWINIIELFMDS
jgi:hypothetical protein